MALTTIAAVESVRPPVPGGRFADDPTLLEQMTDALDAASTWFETRVGRALASASRSYLLSGNGTHVLKIPHWPITAVTSLTVQTVPWTVLVAGGTDTGQYAMLHESGKWLIARYWYWPKGYGNIQATITAGYTTIPDDIQRVVAMQAWLLYEEQNRLGINATSLGPEHVNMVARNAEDYEFMKTVIEQYSREW